MTTTPQDDALVLPEDPGRLTDQERKDLDKATAEFDRAKSVQAKQVAQAKINSLALKPKQRATVANRRDRLDQTVALAQARGEEVDKASVKGAVTIISRDGLKHLAQLKKLTVAQYEIGSLYRQGYETREQDMGAMNIGDSSGGGHDNNAFIAKRFERAQFLIFVARTDRVVALGCIKHPQALQMLRWVAGQGNSISAWGEGRAHARNVEALRAALDAAAVVAKVMREERRKKAEQQALVARNLADTPS